MKKGVFILLQLLIFTLNGQNDVFTEEYEFNSGDIKSLFADNVKFRVAPDLNSEVIELLKIGAAIKIIEKTEQKYMYAGINSDWYKVEVNGEIGFILGALISLENLVSTADNTTFYTQIKKVNNGLILQIRYKSHQKNYEQITVDLYTSVFKMNIFNGKDLTNVHNIIKIDSYSDPSEDSAEIYVFWDGIKLKHIVDFYIQADFPVFNDIKLIFPNDNGGSENRIIYQKEEARYDPQSEDLQWKESKNGRKDFIWDGEKLIEEKPEKFNKYYSLHPSEKAILKDKNTCELCHDVLIKNDFGNDTFFMSGDDIIKRNIEYHNGNVYLLKRVEASSMNNDWADELWKYDQNKNETKLFTGQGVSFQVSPNEELIAVTSYSDSGGEEISILNKSGGILKKYKMEEFLEYEYINDLYFELMKWSDDSKSIWGGILMTDSIEAFFQLKIIDALVFDVNVYTPVFFDFSIYDGYDLDANTGLLVFTDAPAVHDVGLNDYYRREGTKIKLKVFNFQTNQIKEITSSKYKMFAPKWVGPSEIEYNDPLSGRRVQKKVDQHLIVY